jgi:hypothetical protein
MKFSNARGLVWALAAAAVLPVCRRASAQEAPGARPPQAAEGAAPSGAASGGEAAHWPNLSDPDRWTVQLLPRAWYVSPSGKFRLPSTQPTAGNQVRVETLNLDAPRFSPYGEVQVRADAFRFAISAASYSVDRSATSDRAFRLGDVEVAAGQVTDSSFELTTLQASVGYRFFTKDFGQDGGGRPGMTMLHLEGLAGLRLYEVDIDVSGPGGARSGSDETFGEPFVGARAELRLVRDFSVEVELNGGGFGDGDRSVYSLDTVLGFAWRPWEAVGVQIGWRQLLFNFQDGEGASEFEYQGGLAGLYGGVMIRF